MSVFIGVLVLIIGLVSAIWLLNSSYKEFKKDENKRSDKVLFLISAILEILIPSSLSGFAIFLSLVAIIIGLALISGLFN